MNKVFKIVFNTVRGKMMVVNEATSSIQAGKKSAVAVAVIGALLSAGSVVAADLGHFTEADNGTTIKAGETFSFCSTVGKATSDKGYQEADVWHFD